MLGRVLVLASLLTGLLLAPAAAQTTGLVPLSDLGAGLYRGFEGGLYPGGANTPPPAHAAEAMTKAAQVVPRDASGNPDPEGWIVMIAIGMSNTAHEFAVFERDQDRNPNRNARLVILDTALGGQAAAIMANPSASYWSFVEQRLAAMGLTRAQVQVAWLKQAEANPPNDFPGHALGLRDNLERIANNLRDKFPNLALCYLSSRIYAGYATGSLNPEPQAYESGFSVKWLIADQIAGDPDLNHGQLPGPVRAPLLLWGPYLWADGTNPRSDGLVWSRADLEGDGTHPAPSGEQKVADLLSAFFPTEPTAASWWPARPEVTLVALEATDDAHVRAAAPDGNFGAEPQLLEQGGASPTNVYLGFDVTGVSRPALLAKLSLRVVNGGGGRVSRVAETAWDESTIAFSNAPAIGPALVDMPQSSRDGTIGAGVTAEVNADADGLVSFALTTPASGTLNYWSKEGGQPPRLVLALPCATPDADGDGRGDACDCAPTDPSAFAKPGEVVNLRWAGPATLAWASQSAIAGSGTRYDVMAGDLAEVGSLGPNPGDVCVANDLAATTLVDPTPAPASGRGRFFLVRGENACGKGRWETATSGADRTTTACP